jgi:hypothetical protein
MITIDWRFPAFLLTASSVLHSSSSPSKPSEELKDIMVGGMRTRTKRVRRIEVYAGRRYENTYETRHRD